MILNRIELGTACTIKENGKSGKINKIFFYPTKFEVEFSNGQIGHYSSKDIELEGIKQKQVSIKLPKIPQNGIGESWSEWLPFKNESSIEHHFSTTTKIIWEMLTSLDIYNVWFYGIQRALPIIDAERYVHKYSFSKLELKPGAYFKIRPMTIAPWFSCRIMTMEKEKKFGFTFKTTPLSTEYIEFTIKESDYGVWVNCKRKSNGLFSIINQLNWQKKSKDLQRLDHIIPKFNLTSLKENETSNNSNNINLSDENTQKSNTGLESLSKDDLVAYFVNKGLDGDMDAINAHPNKVIRGKAKAMIIKINRGLVEKPSMPKIKASQSNSTSASSGLNSLSKDDLLAYLVNKGLDGDMDSVNNNPDKVMRGKVKALIIKVNRGTNERPAMPEITTNDTSQEQQTIEEETDEQKIERLVAKGLKGDMDEINAIENKVLRGKIKAAVVKAKRAAK